VCNICTTFCWWKLASSIKHYSILQPTIHKFRSQLCSIKQPPQIHSQRSTIMKRCLRAHFFAVFAVAFYVTKVHCPENSALGFFGAFMLLRVETSEWEREKQSTMLLLCVNVAPWGEEGMWNIGIGLNYRDHRTLIQVTRLSLMIHWKLDDEVRKRELSEPILHNKAISIVYI
jgi:hypothetical protein